MSDWHYRFLNLIEKTPTCWLWKGARQKRGYGLFTICGLPNHHRTAKAHRLMWEIFNTASLLPGSVIMHTCDNPPCVNPWHLKLGTTLENVQDRDRKGRRTAMRGTTNARAYMNEEIVLRARKMDQDGMPVREIARQLDIPYSAMWSAIRGKTWAWLGKEKTSSETKKSA